MKSKLANMYDYTLFYTVQIIISIKICNTIKIILLL